VIYAPPAWLHAVLGDWSSVIPSPDDTQMLANLTHHADVNVNMASTMTLDFAIHDKPVVNIAFDIATPPPFGKPIWEFYYRFEHYRPVIELGAARFARSPQELADWLNMYLKEAHIDREARRQLVRLEIGRPVGEASRHLWNALEAIVARQASSKHGRGRSERLRFGSRSQPVAAGAR
jgi:hypothetical protein